MQETKKNDSTFWLIFIVFSAVIYVLLKFLLPLLLVISIVSLSFVIKPRRIHEIVFSLAAALTGSIYAKYKILFTDLIISNFKESLLPKFLENVLYEQLFLLDTAIFIGIVISLTYFVLRHFIPEFFSIILKRINPSKFIQIKPSHFAKNIESQIQTPSLDITHIGKSFLNNKEIVIDTIERTKHLHVVGNSGTGKTNLLKYLIYQDIKNHRPLIIIDCKGDSETREYIKNLVYEEYKSYNKFKCITVSSAFNEYSYNPFYNVEPLTITQMLMSSFDLPREGSSKHYYDLAQTFILNILTCANLIPSKKDELNDLGVFVFLNRFFSRENEPTQMLKAFIENKLSTVGIDEETIDAYIQILFDSKNSKFEIPKAKIDSFTHLLESDDLYLYLYKIRKILSSDRGKSDYAGLSNMLNMFSSEHIKKIFSPNSYNDLKLAEAITKNDIVLFQLSNQELPNFSELLGRLVISDICIRSGKIISNSNQKKIIPIHIDEFPLIASEEFATLLANARSSGLAFTIYHQALSQLNKVSGSIRNDLREKISSVITTKIAFRQDNPEDVTWFVNQSGTFETREETRVEENSIFGKSATGRSSSRAADQTKINYNTIKELKVGEAILIKKTPKLEIEAVKIPFIKNETNKSQNIHTHKFLKR